MSGGLGVFFKESVSSQLARAEAWNTAAISALQSDDAIKMKTAFSLGREEFVNTPFEAFASADTPLAPESKMSNEDVFYIHCKYHTHTIPPSTHRVSRAYCALWVNHPT
jgi:hypothetical protein